VMLFLWGNTQLQKIAIEEKEESTQCMEQWRKVCSGFNLTVSPPLPHNGLFLVPSIAYVITYAALSKFAILLHKDYSAKSRHPIAKIYY